MLAKSFKPRFAAPSVLRSIDPALLCQLLRPYGRSLADAGIVLDNPAGLNIDALSLLLMSGSGLPDELVELICLIDDVAVPRLFDQVLSCARRAGLQVEDEITGHDLAVRVMLADPQSLQDLRTERVSLRPKRYERYMAMTPTAPTPLKRTRSRVRNLEDALDDEFLKRQRQRDKGVVKAYCFDERNGFRLMIRRGDTKRNQPVIDNDDETKTRPLIHRPELYDVVRYDQRHGDLLINARAKADIRAYCYLIGEHLFDDRFAFDPNLAPRRYTLNPIRDDGPACLTCAHIGGIDAVQLFLLQLQSPAHDNTPITIGPGDVFGALGILGGAIDPAAALTRAVFKIRLRGERRDRTVTILPPICAVYERDDAGELVDVFIERAGFLLPRAESLRGAPETLFAMY